MIKKNVIKLIVKTLGHEPIISANGFLSRELFTFAERKSNFYMIGSMGLSSSIGLGIALKNTGKRVFVFDGDGNLFMNLGTLITIGTLKPKNLVHVLFDNAIHESTGGQPTNSEMVSISEFAKNSNYTAFSANSYLKLKKILNDIKTIDGPIMIVIKINKSKNIGNRVTIPPPLIKRRFMNSLKCDTT